MQLTLYKNMINLLRLSAVGVILGSSIFNFSPDYAKIVITAVCSVSMGLIMRLAADWKQGQLTLKSACIQTVFSMGTGYVLFFILNGNTYMGLRQEVVLTMGSFLAAYLVSSFDTVGRKRTRGFMEVLFDWLTARRKIEVDEDKDKPKLD